MSKWNDAAATAGCNRLACSRSSSAVSKYWNLCDNELARDGWGFDAVAQKKQGNQIMRDVRKDGSPKVAGVDVEPAQADAVNEGDDDVAGMPKARVVEDAEAEAGNKNVELLLGYPAEEDFFAEAAKHGHDDEVDGFEFGHHRQEEVFHKVAESGEGVGF